MGKAYANRKPRAERPESDFYRTPESLTRLILPYLGLEAYSYVYEPMAGDGAITSVLGENGVRYYADDIRTTGRDFLFCTAEHPYILTNPAFSLFDETVLKCKAIAAHGFCLLGKVNFFGAHSRTERGVWRNLRDVYIFDRQVDYRTPAGQNGRFCVGNLVTGWFVWDTEWHEPWWRTHTLDVQEYATLGSYDRAFGP